VLIQAVLPLRVPDEREMGVEDERQEAE